MASEIRKERIIWQGIVPIVGAVIATWFQASAIEKAQLTDVVTLMKNPALTAQQKLQVLELYKEISDRPWGVVRSLVSFLSGAGALAIGALVAGGFFQKRS